MVRHPETAVVERAIQRIVSTVRVTGLITDPCHRLSLMITPGCR
jgi:hypothetical protein